MASSVWLAVASTSAANQAYRIESVAAKNKKKKDSISGHGNDRYAGMPLWACA